MIHFALREHRAKSGEHIPDFIVLKKKKSLGSFQYCLLKGQHMIAPIDCMCKYIFINQGLGHCVKNGCTFLEEQINNLSQTSY